MYPTYEVMAASLPVQLNAEYNMNNHRVCEMMYDAFHGIRVFPDKELLAGGQRIIRTGGVQALKINIQVVLRMYPYMGGFMKQLWNTLIMTQLTTIDA